MVKGDRSSSSTREPKDANQQQVSSIPAMFRTAQGEGLKAAASPKHPVPLGGSSPAADGAIGPYNPETQPGPPAQHQPQALCLADLQAVALDIKATLAAAVTDLKTEIQTVAARMGSV